MARKVLTVSIPEYLLHKFNKYCHYHPNSGKSGNLFIRSRIVEKIIYNYLISNGVSMQYTVPEVDPDPESSLIPTCKTCRYFHSGKSICRLHPPAPIQEFAQVGEYAKSETVFRQPSVSENDYCSHHAQVVQ